MKRKRRRKWFRKKKKENLFKLLALCVGLSLLTLLAKVILFPSEDSFKRNEKPKIQEALLSKNKYSRPGISIQRVNGIVIHYVANPGSTAMANRNYFENLKDNHKRKASSHFIIGLDGEIIQCIPLDEIAYASNKRNKDTISIECCHPKRDGKFNDKTYRALLDLTVWLCEEYDLSKDDIIRHYDVTGKICPKYYVEHPKQWTQFLDRVNLLQKNK